MKYVVYWEMCPEDFDKIIPLFKKMQELRDTKDYPKALAPTYAFAGQLSGFTLYEVDDPQQILDAVEVPIANRIGAENGAWAIMGEALADERHIQFPPKRVIPCAAAQFFLFVCHNWSDSDAQILRVKEMLHQ